MRTIYVKDNENIQILHKVTTWVKRDKVEVVNFINQKLSINDILIVAKEDVQDIENMCCNVLIYEEILAELSQGVYTELYNNYDYYYLKNALSRAIEENTHTLICGSSYLRFGIEDDLLRDGIINCSLASQDFFYALCILKYVLNYNRNLQNLILDGAYYRMFTDLSKTKNKSELQRITDVYYPLFGELHNCIFLPATSRNIQRSEVFDIEKIYEQSITIHFKENSYYSSYRSRKSMASKLWADKSKTWQEINETEKVNVGQERACLHNKLIKHVKSFYENKRILNEIVAICKSQKINIIFVTTPVTQYYRDFFEPEYKKIFYDELDSLECSIHMIDLFESEEFLEEDFNDMDHMGDSGAVKITNIINYICEELGVEANRY